MRWLSSYHEADANCSEPIVDPSSDRASIGPFARFRLDKALGLSIGLWCVGFGEDLAETEAFAGGPEAL